MEREEYLMDTVRVLVIDDSAFMRKVISQLLTENHRIEVIATGRNGKEGLTKIEQFQPDVITLDVEMPVMDGITTLQHIMERFPTPVVMLSSRTANGAEETIKAIEFGAVDFIEKPAGPISLHMDHIQAEMIETILSAAQANVNKREIQHPQMTKEAIEQKYNQSIVTIGTSTGGPRALQTVLTPLPVDFPAPIVIVQHMPPHFTKSLAERLDRICAIQVKEAEHGELILKGTAYIAPGDQHMHVRQVGTSLAVELSKNAPVTGHRPSVDVLFHSIASLRRLNKIAIILTGMGKDGSKGIQMMKEHDETSFVIAESKETTIVNGMPQAAMQTNVVNEVLALHAIGHKIIDYTKRTRG